MENDHDNRGPDHRGKERGDEKACLVQEKEKNEKKCGGKNISVAQ
jgi:hypothetical protein